MRSFAIAAALSLWIGTVGAQPLRMKGRLNAGRPRAVHPTSAAGTHFLLQFHRYPDASVRAELTRRGMRVLEYVPDNGLLVSGSAIELRGLELASWGPVQAADKLSPLLDGLLGGAFLVEFYSDADMVRASAAVVALGFDVLENASLLPQQLVVAGSLARLEALAQLDEVKYILPATPELAAGQVMVGCAGALTEAGAIGDYVLVGRGWPKDASGSVDLKYFFLSLSDRVDPNLARSEIERALREWTRYAKVTLSPGMQASAERSIDILFGRGKHGDAYPFDGPGGILAHTFYPAPPNPEPVAGDMHLDAEESWHVGSAVDLYSVALHEAGHALGLGHSDQPGAVMYPYYKTATGLTSDDIAAIQALYGGAGNPTTPPPAPPPTPTPNPPTTPPSGRDTVAPTITILAPGSTIVSTTSSSIVFSGTAADNVGVVAVRWVASTGGSGTASGTTAWSATILLLSGTNVVTIRAYDAAGNSAWRAVTVVRR